jgi:hypothetical protein
MFKEGADGAGNLADQRRSGHGRSDLPDHAHQDCDAIVPSKVDRRSGRLAPFGRRVRSPSPAAVEFSAGPAAPTDIVQMSFIEDDDMVETSRWIEPNSRSV